MSTEEKIRLLMLGGEATGRLFSRMPSNQKRIETGNPRNGRLFVPKPLDEVPNQPRAQRIGLDGMTDEERDEFWKEMRQAEEPYPDNPDVVKLIRL